jgi:hypothetical protein
LKEEVVAVHVREVVQDDLDGIQHVVRFIGLASVDCHLSE